MTSPALENDLKSAIRTIPDYPKPGIMFRDITTLLGDARAFRRALDTALITASEARDHELIKKLDAVAGRVLSTK